MRKFLIAAGALASLAIPVAAHAAPASQGACRQAVHDAVVDYYGAPTYGNAVSDGFYGNQPNMVDGHIVPSQSPGPFVTDPATGEVSRGMTWGEFQQAYIKPACNG